jgi:DNA uptake protein ComE-like DNA-binding protein
MLVAGVAAAPAQVMRAPSYYTTRQGSPPAARAAAERPAADGLLDLNTATAAQLVSLPGMGPVYAQRVLAGRPYSAKNQLVTRGVLPRSAYEQIQSLIVARRHYQR